jgi:hypothetical protein
VEAINGILPSWLSDDFAVGWLVFDRKRRAPRRLPGKKRLVYFEKKIWQHVLQLLGKER